jgi:DNA-directed RNA polymerase specialized sigma24 family protein
VNWERIEKWDYIAIAVSSEYHKKFGMVELEDIKQALYQWFVEHPNKLNEWEAIGEKDAKNLIYRSLRNRALDYCQRWKAKSVGYEYSDSYYYKPELVEALLPTVLRGGLKLGSKQPNLGFTGRPSAPAEGGDLLVLILEIDSAFWKLSKEDKRLLFLRHAESFDFKEIANSLELFSEDTARMRHKRAIKRLVNKLGGYKPYVDRDISSKEDETEEDSIEDSNNNANSKEWDEDRSDEHE